MRVLFLTTLLLMSTMIVPPASALIVGLGVDSGSGERCIGTCEGKGSGGGGGNGPEYRVVVYVGGSGEACVSTTSIVCTIERVIGMNTL